MELILQNRSEMLAALTTLLGYASLDAEELEDLELVQAIDRAANIASQRIDQIRTQ